MPKDEPVHHPGLGQENQLQQQQQQPEQEQHLQMEIELQQPLVPQQSPAGLPVVAQQLQPSQQLQPLPPPVIQSPESASVSAAAAVVAAGFLPLA